jgi:hypothetical protein
MELAAMMSALQLAKMAFNHQNAPHIAIWTDCKARHLYLLNKHRLSIRWQYSHPEQDKYEKKTKELKRAKKTPIEFNYQEWGNYLADIISRKQGEQSSSIHSPNQRLHYLRDHGTGD